MEQILPGYTRISEILSIFQSYSHVDRAKLKKAQDIGTLVHTAIEAYFKGEFVPVVMPITPYFESFLKWADKQEIVPLVIEERLYDEELKITGRIDLLAEVENLSVVVDFKTGSWAHPEIWALQGAFYRHLLKVNDRQEVLPYHYLFVQLKGDGSEPTLFPIEYKLGHWDVCLAAIQCYNYFKQKTPP